MAKIDARKLSQTEQLELKKQALELIEQGVRNNDISVQLGVHKVTISRWKKGEVKCSVRGRKKGEHKKLTKSDEEKIYTDFLKANPTEYDSSSLFWTKKSILEMIKKKYKKNIPDSTLGDYLESWNLNSKSLKEFKLKFIHDVDDRTYEVIKYQAKAQFANIWWIHISQQTHHYKDGKCSVLVINNNIGTQMLDMYDSLDIMDSFNQFLKKATSSSNKNFFLIVHGLNEKQFRTLKSVIKKDYGSVLEFIPANLLNIQGEC